MAEPWENDAIVKPASASSEPWKNDAVVQPASESVPAPFLNRLAQGQAMSDAYEQAAGKPYSQKIKEWSAAQYQSGTNMGRDLAVVGAAGAFIAGIGESLAHGARHAGDILDGKILTGPGLRREDFTDNPSPGWQHAEPLDALIEGANDMAMLGGVGTSSAPRVTLESAGRMPLLRQADGQFVRPYVDPEGTVRGQAVGGMPKPVDFTDAAEAIKRQHIEPQPPGTTEQTSVAEVEGLLRQLWREEGIHPAEAAHDAANDAFVRHNLTTKGNTFSREELASIDRKLNGQEEGDIPLRSMGAENSQAPHVPLSQQPASPPGRLSAAIDEASNQLFDLGRDAQRLLSPMTMGPPAARAIAKDFADALRKNRWEWSRIDDEITKRFTPEERENLWNRADEESVLRQQGITDPTKGLARLPIEQRVFLERMNVRAQNAWNRALDLGMVEGQGLPFYTPRMIINAVGHVGEGAGISLNGIGHNLRTSTANLLHRKYLTAEETEAAAKAAGGELVRDIRTLPLAIARLEDAIAGRKLIEAIKKYGKSTGDDRVIEGAIPADVDAKQWFTMQEHPAFWTWRNTPKTIEIPGGQGASVAATHEMGIDPGLQRGLERVARELGVSIKQPLRSQDPFLKSNPNAQGYTSRAQSDVVSTFGNAQTVLEHELGHKIDFRYHLSTTIKSESIKAWQELGELALHRVDENSRAAIRAQPDYLKKLNEHRPYNSISSYDDYLLSSEERVANMLHAYWYTPKLFHSVAPNAARWFDNFLAQAPDSLKQAIKSVEPSLQGETRRIQEQSSVLSNPTSISVDQWAKVPIFVHKDFEGPLRAVLSKPDGAIYSGVLSLKAKSTGLIMNSPAIHNMVEWGRALPALPGKVATFKVYFEGNAMKQGYEFRSVPQYVMDWWNGTRVPVTRGNADMIEAINHGLVPIGKRFFNQDITSLMEEPNLTPGRSWTAKVTGAVPGLFDEAAGVATKRAIDKAGDFWHNTLLWDRIGDLQAGLYKNFLDEAVAKGIDRNTAAYMAAHWANRFAGSLPQEAMSASARKVANVLMFSRTFTLGNIGVMKDMLTGLPKDVMAQIERDMGTVDPKAVGYAKALARRKAISVVMTDIALFYVGNSILQSAIDYMFHDSTLDKEYHGYAERFKTALQNVGENPLALLQPFNFLESLSSTNQNEPNRKDRIYAGLTNDGTAAYARNPIGKIGEEFIGWMTGPLDMMRKKMSTLARPLWQIASNDAGFGRKVYDPTADSIGKYVWNAVQIAKFFAEAQAPSGQIQAAVNLVKGEGDQRLNAAQAFGPIAGVTFSKGYPGGPQIGFAKSVLNQRNIEFQMALPDLRKQILRGDTVGAQERMLEMGIPPGLQNWTINTSLDPSTRLSGRAIKDFYTRATPEQMQQFEELSKGR